MEHYAQKAQRSVNLQSEHSKVGAFIQRGGYYSRRQLRGLGIIARGGQVIRISSDAFKVRSQSSCHVYNVVKVSNRWTCNCPDFSKRLKPCKHIFAVTSLLQLPEMVAANGLDGDKAYNTNGISMPKIANDYGQL